MAQPPFRFYLISDCRGSRHDPAALLPRLVGAGLGALQIREKELPPADLAALCDQWVTALGDARPRVRLYLNDRADLALALGLNGVHLREDSLPLARQPAALRATLSWGVSTHDLAGLHRAADAGADFATFGPVFPTASKAAYGDPVGLRALEQAARESTLPLFALGGVTPERTAECLAAGAHGVAAISAIWQADDPLHALEAFSAALGGL